MGRRHRKHHAATDTADDPHSPIVHGFWRVQLANAALYRRAARNELTAHKYGRDLPPDRLDRLFFDHAFWGLGLGITVAIATSMLLGFGPWVGLAAALLHMVGYLMLSGAINAVGHVKGKRPFENSATNLQSVALITGGEGLHNNHHAAPTSARFSLQRGQLDPGWLIIRVLSWLHLAHVRHDDVKFKRVCRVNHPARPAPRARWALALSHRSSSATVRLPRRVRRLRRVHRRGIVRDEMAQSAISSRWFRCGPGDDHGGAAHGAGGCFREHCVAGQERGVLRFTEPFAQVAHLETGRDERLEVLADIVHVVAYERQRVSGRSPETRPRRRGALRRMHVGDHRGAARPQDAGHLGDGGLDFTFVAQRKCARDEIDAVVIPTGPLGDSIRLGRQIFNNTPKFAEKYVGNKMSCTHCHIGGGTVSEGMPMVGLPGMFPMYRDREKTVITFEERIEQCFQRSESGHRVPNDGP